MAVGGLLAPDQVADWGWRLPFIFGLTIIPASLYIRWSIPEIERPAHAPTRTPLREAAASHKLLLILGMGAFALVSVANYCLAFYLPTYAVHDLGLPPVGAFAGTLLIGTVQTVLSPVFGALSDRRGRAPVMIVAALGLAAATIPAFLFVVGHPTVMTLLISQLVLGILLTAYQAPMPAFLCDLFPPSLSATGVAIVHDFTATLVGGFTPFAVTLAIGLSGSKLIPGVYVALAAVLSFGCMVAIRSVTRLRAGQPAPISGG
jgi:MHS family proline/betaine transporter-like MFS transporter